MYVLEEKQIIIQRGDYKECTSQSSIHQIYSFEKGYTFQSLIYFQFV